MPKLLCKPKHRVVIESKSNIFYEIDYDNFDAVFFGESKKSLKMCSDYTKHLSGNAIAKKKKWICKTLSRTRSEVQKLIRRKLMKGKAGLFLGRSKKLYIPLRILSQQQNFLHASENMAA